MSWNQKTHNSMNSSRTELHSYEISQRTPTKKNGNSNNYSNVEHSRNKTPRSASSIKSFIYSSKRREDPQEAELIFSAKIASEKSRDILYSSTMKSSSPSAIKSDEWRPSNFSPSTETDTSTIKGFESHVLRIRTPPKKNPIPSPSSKIIIMPNSPNLTPTKKEKDKLMNEIDDFLERIEKEKKSDV